MEQLISKGVILDDPAGPLIIGLNKETHHTLQFLNLNLKSKRLDATGKKYYETIYKGRQVLFVPKDSKMFIDNAYRLQTGEWPDHVEMEKEAAKVFDLNGSLGAAKSHTGDPEFELSNLPTGWMPYMLRGVSRLEKEAALGDIRSFHSLCLLTRSQTANRALKRVMKIFAANANTIFQINKEEALVLISVITELFKEYIDGKYRSPHVESILDAQRVLLDSLDEDLRLEWKCRFYNLDQLADLSVRDLDSMKQILKLATEDDPELAPIIRNIFLSKKFEPIIGNFFRPDRRIPPTTVGEQQEIEDLLVVQRMLIEKMFDKTSWLAVKSIFSEIDDRDELAKSNSLVAFYLALERMHHLQIDESESQKIPERDIEWPSGLIANQTIRSRHFSSDEVALLLALKRDHPLIAALLQENENALEGHRLIEAKPATETKILHFVDHDEDRTFARTATDLGAEVYTISFQPFKSHDTETREASDLAKSRHLQIDYFRSDAIDIIRFMFGGDFDLVTADFLFIDSMPKVQLLTAHLALYLLKKEGGIYFDRHNVYITKPTPMALT